MSERCPRCDIEANSDTFFVPGMPHYTATGVCLPEPRKLDARPGPLEYTVIDEPAHIDHHALAARLDRIESLLKHSDTCPCAHGAWARAASPQEVDGA